MGGAAESLATTLGYHERTKHYPGRYARALGHMDWATQPDPFRRFVGAPLLDLELVPVGTHPRYEPAFFPGRIPPARLDRRSISQLFHDSLAPSAWKQAGGERWPLRVNPLSGNLHPTEGYLVAGPVAGLHDRAAVFHYAPREHALERRAELRDETWAALAGQLPRGSVLVGLTSIHWREAWKYGERAFRYCHHDVGHAIGAVTVAAAALGWDTRLCEGVTDTDLARLLGTDSQSGPEAENADCLLALSPHGAPFYVDEQRSFTLALPSGARWPTDWNGAPNRLSPEHGQDWPVIHEVAEATRKLEPPSASFWQESSVDSSVDNPGLIEGDSPLALRPILHQRRSAVAFDGRTGLAREAFFQILLKSVPGRGQIPFATLPWRPRVDLLLFVHRVQDVLPGLYILLRGPGRQETLRGLMAPSFAWTPAEGSPVLATMIIRAKRHRNFVGDRR